MAKKQANFRLEEETLSMMDKLVKYFSDETGFKIDRTKLIEKLVSDSYGQFNPLHEEDQQQSSSPE